jgi:tetratricopeptide (TPR) repeat protein
MRMFFLLLVTLLGACASKSALITSLPEPDLVKAVSGDLIFGRPIKEDELPDLDLFGLTPSMQQFAENAVKNGNSDADKAELLHLALIRSGVQGGQGITYSTFNTGTAREVFETGQANCLGYTLLYVSLAKSVGLKAQVNQVMVPPTWDMNSKRSYFLMRHVNAKVVSHKSRWSLVREAHRISDVSDVVVDLEIRRFRTNYRQKPLDDISTEALFYNNRAMEFSSVEDEKNSFLYLRRALKAKYDQSFIWSNLASLYRKRGNLELAEVTYLHALSLDGKDLTVLHNLASLYKQSGDLQKSEIYRKKVQRYRNSNPYYLYQAAASAKEAKDIPKALDYIRRAIKKETGDDRLYLLAVEIMTAAGDIKGAEKMQKKADELKNVY